MKPCYLSTNTVTAPIHTYLHTGPELPLVEQVGTAILVLEHTAHNIKHTFNHIFMG